MGRSPALKDVQPLGWAATTPSDRRHAQSAADRHQQWLLISHRAAEMRWASRMPKLGVSSITELLDLAIGYRIQTELRQSHRQQRIG